MTITETKITESIDIWKPNNELAEQIIKMPERTIWIDKPTQVGCTTSIGLACKRLGLRFTELAPTNKIITDTVGESIMKGEEFGRIGSNSTMCPYASKEDFFGLRYTSCLYKGMKCKNVGGKCSHGFCEYKYNIEKDFKIKGIVYSKMTNLFSHVESKIYENSMEYIKDKLTEQIFNSDVILLDEFPRLIVYKPPGFYLEDLKYVYDRIKPSLESSILECAKKSDFERAERYEKLRQILSTFLDSLEKTTLDKSKNEKSYGIYENIKKLEIHEASAYGETSMQALNSLKGSIINLFNLKIGKDDEVIKQLQTIMMAMTYDEIWVTTKKYDIKDDMDKVVSTIEKKYAIPNIQHPFNILKPYLEEFIKKGGKVIATGMKFPVIENSFDWKRVVWSDFNKTESKHLVVCDTKTMSFQPPKKYEMKDGKCTNPQNWLRDLPKIKKLIMNAKKQFVNLPVIVFAFNRNVYTKLHNWIEKLKETEPLAKDILIADSLCFTYFRSALGSGVRLEYPIKFYIGAADTPTEAYADAELLYDIPKDYLRIIEMSDTFKNSIGRGKDPEGKARSISFVIGAQMNKVLKLFPEKKEIVEVFTEGTIYHLSTYYTWAWFTQWGKIKELNDLPLFLDMLNYCVLRAVRNRKIQTTYRQIYDNWKQKKGIDIGIGEIKRILWSNKNLTPNFMFYDPTRIKVDVNKNSKFFLELVKMYEDNDNEPLSFCDIIQNDEIELN